MGKPLVVPYTTAILVVLVVTLILVKGISESAGFNALMVAIKVAAVLFVIGVGAFYVTTANWSADFAPYGWTGVSFFGTPLLGKSNAAGEPVGVLAGAAIIFFAYIGFDSVSTHAEEARNPRRDVPIGIIASLLICTVLYIGVVAVLAAVIVGNWIPGSPFEPLFSLSKDGTILALTSYGFVASVLPVWLLLCPLLLYVELPVVSCDVEFVSVWLEAAPAFAAGPLVTALWLEPD